ncbi:MAG: hypothetical protein KF858_10215 [Candidatus Sumerlaeia bacterium]|nr:hypothetical protein [Candidatus Sumerlaeia bacterium]
MYCEDSRATDIEHIRPKEHYPEVAFVWENYAYACNVCNQQYKSDRYCEGFLDPTVAGFDVWEHWRFDPATGALIARPGTPAEETLRILGFKHDARKPERTDLTIRRRDFYGLVVHLVRSYGVARRTGDVAETKQVVDQLRSPLQFASIVEWALRNRQPAENDRSVRLVLDAYPELPDLVLTG